MNIMAFGTGIRVELGYFNAGWIGMVLSASPIPWRPPLSTVARPVWASVAVTKTQWEER